jgi:hypothetical protein
VISFATSFGTVDTSQTPNGFGSGSNFSGTLINSGTIRAIGGAGQIDADDDDGAFRFYDGSTFRGGFGTDKWATGASAADLTLFVNGNNSLFVYANSAKRVRMYTDGIVTSGDVVAYGSPSDARLKIIKEKVPNAVEKISKISGYRFDWKNPDDLLNIKEDVGVIAQEVQEVFPELVRMNESGYYSVREKGLIAVLIEAVKELSEQNKKLEEKNREFETILESLINRQK